MNFTNQLYEYLYDCGAARSGLGWIGKNCLLVTQQYEQKCYQKQVQIMTEQTGIKKDLCGKCFAVCAFTKKYIGECHNGVRIM